jgi:tetratricopeptide (TPR) repeat protein
MAMEAARGDPALGDPARTVLLKQSAWFDKQGRLADEQIGLARHERFRNRMKSIRDGLLALGVLGLLAAVSAVVWSARRAEGLVVEALSVPPEMAERGLTGGAVAAQLLDKLSAMQAQTDSGRAPGSYGANWAEDRSVEIPQTGVSVGQAYQALKQALGRETRVSGEVFRRADGDLALVVRAGAEPGFTVTGPARDLDRHLQTAAEKLFEQNQPYRYAVFLGRNGRQEERVATLRRLLSHPSPIERVWAYNGLAVLESMPSVQAVGILQEGLEVVPDHPWLLGNLASMHLALGHDEKALAASERQSRQFVRGRNIDDINPVAVAIYKLVGPASDAAARGDFGPALENYPKVAALPDQNNGRLTAAAALAEALARTHDTGPAARAAARTGLPDDAAIVRTLSTATVLPYTTIAEARGDWPAAATQLIAVEEAAAAVLPPRDAPQRLTGIVPRLAHALVRTGRVSEAEDLIAATPLDCYLCVRTRGKLAALRGEHAAADRWFAEAVRQGPSLPFAHAEWGEAKLARGDADGAVKAFREAQARGPRWADPLKWEGDALARQGKHAAAVRRYVEAAERAPRWGALHLAWGRSLQALGRPEEARAKFAEAARLDLSAADRAETRTRLGARK